MDPAHPLHPPPTLKIPLSTYRLQLCRDFTFDDAAALVPYLSDLGIGDLYVSPFLAAVPGSPHGYDICDHSRINPELGGEEGLDRLCAALRERGLGLLADFVSNHAGAHPAANPWWRDVLENGPSSPYARFFDIDWRSLKPELRNKVLLPILGDQYGVVLERGELRLGLREGSFYLAYEDHDVPLNARECARVLEHRKEALEAALPPGDDSLQEYLDLIAGLKSLPASTENDPDRVGPARAQKEVYRDRLCRLLQSSAAVRGHLEENLRIFNGRPGNPESFDLLHALLEAQPYRLASWRTSLDEINYRRFFDINTLAGLRQEEDEVFRRVHASTLDLIRAGKITGLRLDHVDGLYDPSGYLAKLQGAIAGQSSWTPGANLPFYLVVEKVLSLREPLPPSWPVHGTTGYDFLNDLNGLFVEPRNALALKKFYARYTGRTSPFARVVYESKYRIMVDSLVGELNVLAWALNRISEWDRRSRDFTLETLRRSLREIAACFPVYRTYVGPGGWTDFDRNAVDAALAEVRALHPMMEPSVLPFIREHLLPSTQSGSSERDRRKLDFAMRFQQYTAPVQAKGLEDTAFYRYPLLISLNEVGGDPQRFGRSLREFHEANLQRRAAFPYGLLATSTHDAKRGEDARARIDVISEIPEEWRRKVLEWSRLNAPHRSQLAGAFVPDRNAEYSLYQTLIGVWPADLESEEAPPDLLERLRIYWIKALREAKEFTSWIHSDPAYEEAALHFLSKVLSGPRSKRFLASFLPFARRLALHGALNSLSQTAVKIASPGVPDFYQGAELWDTRLADPDNRRPVDYHVRRAFLEQILPLLEGSAPRERRSASLQIFLENWADGRVKLYLIAAGLRARRAHPEVFLQGDYRPLSIEGPRADHFIAFARHSGTRFLVLVAPRKTVSLLRPSEELRGPFLFGRNHRLTVSPEWKGCRFEDVLTGRTVFCGPDSLDLAEVLQDFPLALLLGGGTEPPSERF